MAGISSGWISQIARPISPAFNMTDDSKFEKAKKNLEEPVVTEQVMNLIFLSPLQADAGKFLS